MDKNEQKSIPIINIDTKKRDESKNDKFNRIAVIRTNKVLKALRSLSKLANKRRYDFDRGDARKIFNAIRNETLIARAMFDKSLKDNEFTL